MDLVHGAGAAGTERRSPHSPEGLRGGAGGGSGSGLGAAGPPPHEGLTAPPIDTRGGGTEAVSGADGWMGHTRGWEGGRSPTLGLAEASSHWEHSPVDSTAAHVHLLVPQPTPVCLSVLQSTGSHPVPYSRAAARMLLIPPSRNHFYPPTFRELFPTVSAGREV